MADIECGQFTLEGQDPQTGNLTFRAKLTPATSAQWTAVFHEYQAKERAIGNTAVACIKGDVIEFEVPDALAHATALVVRRCIKKTNPETVRRERDRQQQSDAQKKQVNDEWKRVKDKYHDGL